MQTQISIVGMDNVTITAFMTEAEQLDAHTLGVKAEKYSPEDILDNTPRYQKAMKNAAFHQARRRFANQGATETHFFPV